MNECTTKQGKGVIYYKAVNPTPAPTTKSFFKNISRKARFLLPVMFLVIFLATSLVNAQIPGQSTTTDFSQFKCLFEDGEHCQLPITGRSDVDISSGKASGVVYGKVDQFDKDGVKALSMIIGLHMDNSKNKETHYFYSRVADNPTNSFFLRFKYIEPVTGLPLYAFADIPYQEDEVDISKIVLNNGGLIYDTRNTPAGYKLSNGPVSSGSGTQKKVAFYALGPSGWEHITGEVIVKQIKFPNFSMPYGASGEVDLWYCGGQDQDNKKTDGRFAPRDGNTVEYFTTDGKYKDSDGKVHDDGFVGPEMKCHGNKYDSPEAAYKIGETKKITLPSDITTAQIESNKDITSGITDTSYNGSVLPMCSIDPFTNGSVMGCIAQILYGGIFRPVAFFAQIMGKLFDFFMGYSLSDESYRHDFIQTGWQLVRDISNIFFILVMVWSGLVAIFNVSNTSYKKVIPTLIINALIINFSLFATRVVIDISNITARIFYNQMVVKSSDGTVSPPGPGGYKTISASIVSSFNPQKIFEGQVLTRDTASYSDEKKTNEADVASFNGQSNQAEATGGFKRYSSDYATYFALVTIVAILVSFSVAMMFWKTAFIFLGRVIGLYVAMIFSPFAFLSRNNVPLVGKIDTLNFSSWSKDLIQYATLAPIFVFFLYIINSFLNVGFITKLGLDQNSNDFFSSVMYVLIPMLIIYGLVSAAVNIAKKHSGKFGEMAQNFAMKATGVVGGAALGVASLGGSRILGGAAKALNESSAGRWLRDKAPNSSLARMSLKGLDRASNSSWDFRQSGLGKAGFKAMGVDTNPGGLNALKSFGLGLGTDQRKGGLEADIKRRKEDRKKSAKLLEEKMSDEDIKKYNERKKKQYQERKNKIAEESMIAAGTYTKEDLKKLKKTDFATYNTKVAEAIASNPDAKKKTDSIIPPVDLKSSKEVNKDRKKQYAENLAERSFVGRIPLVGAALGAGVRDRGDAEAAKDISKEVKKVEREEGNKKATEKLVEELTAKLEKLEGKDGVGGELTKVNATLSAILEEEASKHSEFSGRDVNSLDLEERDELIKRRETRLSGEMAAFQADYDKAVARYRVTGSDTDKAKLTNAKIALTKAEKDIDKGQELINKKEGIESKIAKTKADKMRAEDRIENMEYRKERKESDDKKNKSEGGSKEKSSSESKPKDETK